MKFSKSIIIKLVLYLIMSIFLLLILNYIKKDSLEYKHYDYVNNIKQVQEKNKITNRFDVKNTFYNFDNNLAIKVHNISKDEILGIKIRIIKNNKAFHELVIKNIKPGNVYHNVFKDISVIDSDIKYYDSEITEITKADKEKLSIYKQEDNHFTNKDYYYLNNMVKYLFPKFDIKKDKTEFLVTNVLKDKIKNIDIYLEDIDNSSLLKLSFDEIGLGQTVKFSNIVNNELNPLNFRIKYIIVKLDNKDAINRYIYIGDIDNTIVADDLSMSHIRNLEVK